jgi:hypothetical protein
MKVGPCDRDTLSFIHSQYHQIYWIFHHIMCTEILVGELWEKKCLLIIHVLERQIYIGLLSKMLVWNKYISYKPQNSWPLLSQLSLPTQQPKMLVHKQRVIFCANKDTSSHILLKTGHHSLLSFPENFTHLHTCSMVSHFTYLAVVRLWFGVSSHLVKPSTWILQMVC